ncbi:NAD(P)/FAD-dependent oxidoreductase [Serratia marcescens]|nr:NAD(P)/FAD-dependent oxidoreductase [Serratia marcescens]
MMEEQTGWDIVVIGGGVVGCAVFRKFCLMGARTLLLEKGGDILSGASKANSALLHTGFDAPSGSLELRCMQAGYREFIAIRERMNLPLLPTGALVVAWDEQQLAALPAIVQQAHDNGVPDVAQIDAAELYRREPQLAPGALAAVEVPGESVIDPWSTPLAYLTQGVKHGGDYRFNTEVTGAERLPTGWRLTSNRGEVHGQIVINCAGNQGDRVESFCHQPEFEIRPRKGQFLVFDKAAAGQINAIILPVPTAITKGVLLAKTIFGNLLLGPTAEEQQDRETATVDETKMRELIEQGTRLLPTLANYSVTASYAGLRPATEQKHYRIQPYPERQWICVAGIRSTGLTAALGIAQYVEQLYRDHFTPCFTPTAPQTVHWPQMPMLADYGLRDYARPDNGGIVCHCELVTQRELEAAFDSAVPPECIGGLRRRTRVMMGRCNGFYCSSRVAEMVGDRFGQTLAVGSIDEN